MSADEIVETRVAEVWRRDDDVVVYRYRAGAVVTLEDAREVVEAAMTLVSSPKPSLVLVKQIRGIEPEARTFFASGELNARVTSSAALVVGSPVSRVIGNFFMGLNRLQVPTRLFDDEAKAVIWLLGQST